MTENAALGEATVAPPESAGRRGKSWAWPAATGAVGVVGGLLAGLAIGGAASDPTQSDEYAALAQDLSIVQSERDDVGDELQDAQARLRQELQTIADREMAAAKLESGLDTRAAELDAREAAIAADEQRVAATTITTGTWTVGVDIEPGTYRTTGELTNCYWAVYRSGTNKGDILQNDIVQGGVATVTLSQGQDFESSRCGDWARQ